MRRILFTVLCFFFLGSITSQAQNLITNGGFENDFTGWQNLAGAGSQASFSVETTEKMEGSKALKVEVSTPGPNFWDVQSIGAAWASVAGKEYTLTFYAKAATNGTRLRVVQQKDSYYAQKDFELTTTYQKYEWKFTPTAADAQLKFNYLVAGTYYIDQVEIQSPATLPNLISNGSFENDFTDWTNLVGGSAVASFAVETSERIDGSKAMKVNVTTPGANAWDVQSIAKPWTAVAGRAYTLTFYAKAATAGARVRAIQQKDTYYAQQEVTLSTAWQKFTWTFTPTVTNPELKFHFLTAGTIYLDQVSLPALSQEVNLIPNGNFETNFTFWFNQASAAASATFALETQDVQEGTKAMRVEVLSPGPNAWDVQSINNAWPSRAGQTYTLSFWAKAARAGSSFKAIQQANTYTEQVFTLSTAWTKYEWTFTAQEANLQLKFHFPSAGTFYIDNITVPGMAEPPFDPTFTTKPAYTPNHPPLATGRTKFLGGAYSNAQAPNFKAYWNQLVAENAGKWGAVESTRDVMNWTELDAAYKFAKDNNMPFRMHVLIWGNQQPAWIENLPAAEQMEEIEEWFAAVAARYPDIAFLEVVNEPTNDPPFKRNASDQGSGNYFEALGGNGSTGWDWVITSFTLARKHFPRTTLMLNDYSVENTTTNAQRYLAIIELLRKRNLIDAIGIQGHAFSTRDASAATLKGNLDLFATTGLPIYVTELDIDGPEEQTQLREYQRIFPIFWEHPAVKGITLWGHRPGHWRTAQGAFLTYANGAERSALEWLKNTYFANNHTPVVAASQVFTVSEAIAANEVFGTLQATDADPLTLPQDWKITGGSGAAILALDARTGSLKVLDNAAFDFEKVPSLTLTVTASDGFKTSAPETITIHLTNANDNAPVVKANQKFVLTEAGAMNLVGTATASDADDQNSPSFTTLQNWQITGGTGASIFAMDASTGKITIANPLQIDFGKTAYTLLVKVSDGINASSAETITVTIPARVIVCHKGIMIKVEKRDALDHLRHGDNLGACNGSLSSISETASVKSAGETFLPENTPQVYPNPAKESISVSLGENTLHINRVILQDVTGRLIKEIDVKGANQIVIPRDNLKSGMYLLRLLGDKEITQRIVVE
ncbi:endo-1,4-beta-xylanase [Rufibacter sediminis]|uniref:endo-1,4-beta-xylanase n=1 Tax=Rufibacter sediminis TaxID=2762756 RepID=A0ABR6VWU5_9BACT|nr:endo-1,4-beta-xylanase [Rufibacter sediminis]MBC3541670.1 endo-1,4-beta-xylanase [Rufibacter sediminis]